MSRKDYVLIAETIREVFALYVKGGCEEEENAVHALAVRLAATLKGDNAAFDTQRFLQACGVID